MIFVDSNIPMYLVGDRHPNKKAARRALEELVAAGEPLCTDAEVLQEILRRCTEIRRPESVDPAFDAVMAPGPLSRLWHFRTRKCAPFRGSDPALRVDQYDELPPFRIPRERPLPTLLRAGPYRLFMFMADCVERHHVHVEGNDGEAKFWLKPVSLAENVGYSPREIHRIRRIVANHRSLLTDAIERICEQA